MFGQILTPSWRVRGCDILTLTTRHVVRRSTFNIRHGGGQLEAQITFYLQKSVEWYQISRFSLLLVNDPFAVLRVGGQNAILGGHGVFAQQTVDEFVVEGHLSVQRVLLDVAVALFRRGSETYQSVEVVPVVFGVLERQAAAAVAGTHAGALIEEARADLVYHVVLVGPIGGQFLRASRFVLVGDLQRSQHF